jgi:hypothetical protein
MPTMSDHENGPTRVDRLLAEARLRIDAHLRQQRGHSNGFVASDFVRVHEALRQIAAQELASGPVFCEWGSGFGVVAMLASMLGFDACGIEAQSDLVVAAEELAFDFNCDVRFACGSFVGREDDDLTAVVAKSWWHDAEPSGYDELDLQPREIDVFYAYPWPGEEELFDALFVRHAAIGALLLTYHDATGVLVQRKAKPAGPPQVVGWY